MKIDIPYLDKTLHLEFPDENLIVIAEPNELHVTETEEKILHDALVVPYPERIQQNMVSGCSEKNSDEKTGKSIEDFLNGANKILIIVNDGTRPTPTASMLGVLLPAIEKAAPDNLTILIATGAHRAPTEDEYLQILGSEFYKKLRPLCIAHDSKCKNDMVNLGFTKNRTPIFLNKLIFEADRIIVTGSVEPHYFAGFTGGRKAFLPGVASFESIEANHKLALSPCACSLALEGNPVHEDMMEVLKLINVPVFSLMTVLDKEQKIAAAFCGNLIEAFYAAVETAKKIFCVSVPVKADIVISVAKFPMDIDLYQSQKAIDNGALVLKDGGILILVSSCRDGIGDTAYANLLASAASPLEAIDCIKKSYKLGYHKAAKIAEVAARAVIAAVSQIDSGTLKSLFIEKESSLQEALDNALSSIKNKGITVPGIIILPDGCVTVPEAVS